ncbi:MAG: hypothetical protein EP343_32095 [Deltaproteobacteria bacterium]|nr:MAG: hypothetical protein EP343_32095 [Deltaproteobacteria bacterium]
MVKIAKKKKTQQKTSRKDLKGPDQFQEATTQTADWLNDNRSQVIGVLAGILILSLGIYVFRVVSAGSAHAVTKELTETLKIMEGKVEKKKDDKKKKDASTDSSTDDAKTYATEKAKYEAAKKALAGQLKQHSGKKAAAFLHLYMGHSKYRLGKHEEAMVDYKNFLSKLNKSDPIYILGVSSLLRAAEASKKDAEGVKAMEDFLKSGAKVFRPLAALRLAEYYERKNDTKKAKEYYKQLAETKSLEALAGTKKLSQTLTQMQTKAKRRLSLLP